MYNQGVAPSGNGNGGSGGSGGNGEDGDGSQATSQIGILAGKKYGADMDY